MRELTEKVNLFETLIFNFAKSKLGKANDVFHEKYGYDLRRTSNSDYLKFNSWEITDDTLILLYKESTPSDFPYTISIEFKTNKLFIDYINKI